ncbi:MAG: zinc metallopeptidase [Clostridia bacterium]|nr:zinc metallopeptidase [Clostridia bacterium]MBQ6708168.1 zinc metallopeptidase [Clostridia bacterium]
MYYYFSSDYIWFLGAMLVCMLLSGIVSSRVRTTYAKYSKSRCSSGMTGYDTVARLMNANGVRGISIGQVRGQLSDHYHPTKKIVNLSESTYGNNSVAAVAVAAHEMGHVMQKQNGYFLYRIRTALVPVVNFGSYLAMPLVFIGLLLDMYSVMASPDIGFKVAMVGVILYGGSLLFALVTLPVELNASRRARNMLLEQGILTEDEIPIAKKVLSAAAMTYFVSLLTSLVYFLRFLLRVLAMFGRRNRR